MKEDADVVSGYLALKTHHRHNKPPSTMLATTPVILRTIHPMNNSYSSMVYASNSSKRPNVSNR